MTDIISHKNRPIAFSLIASLDDKCCVSDLAAWMRAPEGLAHIHPSSSLGHISPVKLLGI